MCHALPVEARYFARGRVGVSLGAAALGPDCIVMAEVKREKEYEDEKLA